MEELQKELSNIVGLEGLKSQLYSWAKRLILDETRRKHGISVGKNPLPHTAFLGSTGTGKTSVARILGKLLYNLRILPNNKVVEVQRSDLVGEYVGHTGPKTKEKIKEAEGGILFVDEAYRLMVSGTPEDFGKEALEEIMHAMDCGRLSVIFACYKEEMQHVFACNKGLHRRFDTYVFQDFTCKELAKILHLKMSRNEEGSFLGGFKLDPSCSLDVVGALIESNISKEQREKMNGGLVDQMLVKARENLDRRLDVNCVDLNKLITITLEDLKASVSLLNKDHPDDNVIQETSVVDDMSSDVARMRIEEGMELLEVAPMVSRMDQDIGNVTRGFVDDMLSCDKH